MQRRPRNSEIPVDDALPEPTTPSVQAWTAHGALESVEKGASEDSGMVQAVVYSLQTHEQTLALLLEALCYHEASVCW